MQISSCNEQQALYQAILDNPNDDQIRLIYSDYLEEYGTEDWEFEHAKYIRLAIEDNLTTKLERIHLLDEFGNKWGKIKYKTKFTKGFPSHYCTNVTGTVEPYYGGMNYINKYPIYSLVIDNIDLYGLDIITLNKRWKFIEELYIEKIINNDTDNYNDLQTDGLIRFDNKRLLNVCLNKKKLCVPYQTLESLNNETITSILQMLKTKGLKEFGCRVYIPVNPILNITRIVENLNIKWLSGFDKHVMSYYE